jgi:hypothetical protein
MSWILNVIIGVLIVALIVLIIVRLRLKRWLESIDGIAGITKQGACTGKVIGGEFTKAYQHKKRNKRSLTHTCVRTPPITGGVFCFG